MGKVHALYLKTNFLDASEAIGEDRMDCAWLTLVFANCLNYPELSFHSIINSVKELNATLKPQNAEKCKWRKWTEVADISSTTLGTLMFVKFSNTDKTMVQKR